MKHKIIIALYHKMAGAFAPVLLRVLTLIIYDRKWVILQHKQIVYDLYAPELPAASHMFSRILENPDDPVF